MHCGVVILVMHDAIISTTPGKGREKYIAAKFYDCSEVCFKWMSHSKGQCGGKQYSKLYGGLAVVPVSGRALVTDLRGEKDTEQE